MTIEFIITFFVFAMAANGLGNLYIYLIRPGQLFSFMQLPIKYFSDKKGILARFIYKSIGGCEICTIQRFGDMAFAFFVSCFVMPGPTWWVCVSWFFLYCLFGGLLFYFTAIASNKNQPQTKKQNIEL